MEQEKTKNWVMEHADQFENDCRPDQRETGVRVPPALEKMLEDRSAAAKAAFERRSKGSAKR